VLGITFGMLVGLMKVPLLSLVHASATTQSYLTPNVVDGLACQKVATLKIYQITQSLDVGEMF